MTQFVGLDYLNTLALWDGKRTFVLEIPIRLLEALGNPQNAIPSIHVAGTNGKGSVCAMLSSILRAQGSSVGQFTSPHLSNVTERCLVNGKPVDTADFNNALLCVKRAAEKERLLPSFFETVAAATFVEFARRGLDWMVVEVGLGGRLDATNVIARPRVSIITGIDYDHLHILGSTLSEIALEKAGIVKAQVPVIIGQMKEEPRAAICEVVKQKGVSVAIVSSEDVDRVDCDNLALGGGYQKVNAALASKVARSLGVAESAISSGLNAVRWPGRLEFLNIKNSLKDVPVLLDVAHNPGGMHALSEFLRERCRGAKNGYKQLIFVVSVLERKNWRLMLDILKDLSCELDELFGVAVRFIFTESGHKSQVSPEILGDYVNEGRVVIASCVEAMHCAFEMSDESSLVVVTGSIFLVGKVRPMLANAEFFTICS